MAKTEEDVLNWEVLTSNPLLERIKYFSERERGVVERIFWMVAFGVSVSSAIILIYRIWAGQASEPVIVTFQSMQQDIDTIPFPAVTICNMNMFPKSAMKRLLSGKTHRDSLNLKLAFVKSLCNEQQSFAKHFKFAASRGEMENETGQINGDQQDTMMDFIMKNTQSCTDLLPLCKLGGQTVNCSRIFKPVLTDHGMCCAFNILPLPLLLKVESLEGESPLKRKIVWSTEELDDWRSWNYHEGLIRDNSALKYPWKQKRAVLPYGLSVLVDPKVDDYFCPASDSKGVRYILHSPLELPHVMELSSVASVNKEVLVHVHPEVTIADDDIKTVAQKTRHCLFGRERRLVLHEAYTMGNCQEECVVRLVNEKCNCLYFHLPGYPTIPVCSNHPSSAEFKCIENILATLQKTMRVACEKCEPLCEHIAYSYETTVADLQSPEELWLDRDLSEGHPPTWATDQVSILHFFFGSDSTIPKLRKMRSSPTDMIASTGGILGLCIGFSVLSFVEIIYFVVSRAFRRYFKRICKRLFRSRRRGLVTKTVWVNSSKVPIYPSTFSTFNSTGKRAMTT